MIRIRFLDTLGVLEPYFLVEKAVFGENFATFRLKLGGVWGNKSRNVMTQ